MANLRNDQLALIDAWGTHLNGYQIADVGACGSEKDEIYTPALAIPGVECTGFEPNESECARLNQVAPPNFRFLPVAIGDGNTRTFYVCRQPLVSSLLEPDQNLISHYENLSEPCQVISVSTSQTKTLDEALIVEAIHFLKIDIQGATLVALQGSTDLLPKTLVVHAETEFLPIYRGESLFSECEIFLRAHGFMFHHFEGMEGRRMLSGNAAVGKHASQSLWADAVFIPSFQRLQTLTDPDLVKLAFTMHAFYGAVDTAMACLNRCRDAQLVTAYRRLLEFHEMLQ